MSLRTIYLLVALASSGPSVLRAETVTFGAIRVDSNSPAVGLLSFVVSNFTGPSLGCDSFFNSCTDLFIGNGLLRINYLDSGNNAQTYAASLPADFGPGETDPFNFVDFTVDPSGWNAIQNVEFSGTLSPALLTLFSGEERVLLPASFFVTFDPNLEFSALLTANAVSPAVVPEPGHFSLLLVALTGLFFVTHRRRRGSRRR